jgi:addiction module HigA family antidote
MTILREDLSKLDFSDVALPDRLAPVTPGEILREEFLKPLNLSARALARDMGVPPNRVTDILNGERGISAETAIKLGKRFGTSARFWMNLQVSYDLAVAERAMA